MPDSSTGALIGADISTDEASAACQSSVGATVTAVGWVPAAAAGYTASATPAASAIGSPPAIRVVFFVAITGMPSCWAALGVPAVGTVTVLMAPLSPPSLPPPPQADRARQAPTRASNEILRIAALTLATPAIESAGLSASRTKSCKASESQESVHHLAGTVCILPPRRIRERP